MVYERLNLGEKGDREREERKWRDKKKIVEVEEKELEEGRRKKEK